MSNFQQTFSYKLIYVFRINDDKHNGLLKVGEATCTTTTSPEDLLPNCKELNLAAKKRINQYTNTAVIDYDLLYTELAIKKNKDGKIVAFSDHDVHKVFERSNIKKHIFDSEHKANEWFKTNLETVKNAINAVKANRQSLLSNEITTTQDPIIFRPEQLKAIHDTKVQFRKGDRMLWNAKMRFGKTLTALQVAKEMGYKKTIILTHRPVVSDGWYEDFGKIFYDTDYVFGSKTKGEKIQNLIDTDKNFVYFASMQDLRGSQAVGGKFDKNDEIFLIDWDYVVIDEAHEGTLTKLGQAVIDEICNQTNRPKILRLSGTPFNLLDQFKEDEIYTWDYVMEQREKRNWDKLHFGDSNPYSSLPELQIYTYDLNKVITGYFDAEENAFNFREFFRTWTGKMEKDFKPIPAGQKVGDFVHEKDVWAFINLLCKQDNNSNYPFSTEEYRNYFRHSLWMVPGVKEAKALSELLSKHPVFGNKQFWHIVNVAGDGDEEVDSKNALSAVRKAFGKNPDETYTITISCSRLTTGVSVPEWTAVLMLSGSAKSDAKPYMQTIFRVQTPANINGRIKEYCCVFDFAPDRTLKMVADVSHLTPKTGSVDETERERMGEFLNFCPVIGIDGSKMAKYDVNILLQQLKKNYTERVVKNGFDDPHIYNDNLLKLDGLELTEFENLKKIIGASKQTKSQGDIDVNKQGLTNEQYEELKRIEKKPKKELTEEEKKRLEELKEKRKNKDTAISILRGISIRIPLLVYGSDVEDNVDITAKNFTNLIDDISWEEFMPKGVTKDVFKKFSKYYEQDVFVSAGRQIRNKAKYADTLTPTERVKKIVEIFSTFKNPDKETVLTPWRVVNMHLSDTLGGYDFYDETHTNLLEEPRFVNQGKVTSDTLSNPNSNILEINSKSGLYPLYVAYSIYRKRCSMLNPNELTKEKQLELWDKTVRENVYVICKTPMARSITKRTLVGYRRVKINAHAFDDLIMQLKDKPEQFKDKILRGNFWNKEVQTMKFDAIVGNPPYQMSDGGAQASATPVYNLFVNVSKKLNANYISMIMPSRWMTGGKGLDKFRDDMIHDKHFLVLHDYTNSKNVFPSVDIKGGICYFLRDRDIEDKCKIYRHDSENVKYSYRNLVEDGDEIFIRNSELITIKNKVAEKDNSSFENIVSPRKPYGLSGDIFKDYSKYNLPNMSDYPLNNGLTVYGLDEKLKRVTRYADINYPLPKRDYVKGYKLFMSRNQGSGNFGEEFSTPIFAKPNDCCTETFVVIGLFDTEKESQNCWQYIKTKFFRAMVGIRKQDQGASKSIYHYVPLQDFTNESDIDWSKSVTEIDKQLYKKYNLTQEEIDFIEKTVKPME
jgi:hypothetical protein